MACTRQDKKGLAKIATIVALSLLLALSPFLGGCPEERDIPVGVEPDEVIPAKSDEVVPDPVEVEPITEPIIVKPTPGPTDIVAEANFEAIDTHALNVPGLGWECVESLAVYLTEPSKNDLEIARAIFRWITHNIAYDARGFLASDFGCQSPEAVLERGYAVCGGYARLFEALAYAAGLEAEVISP